MRTLLPLLLALVGGLAAAQPASAEVSARVFWNDQAPQIEVALDVDPPAEVTEVAVPVALFDAQNQLLWQTELKISLAGPKPWKAQAALEKIADAKQQHHVELRLRSAALKTDYRETIYFAAPSEQIRTYGFRHTGLFPQRKAAFVLDVAPFRGEGFRDVPVTIAVRDDADQVILSRQDHFTPAADAQRHVFDLTPDTSAGPGPYTVEIAVESEDYSLFFNTSEKFALANCRLPVTSFEHGDRSLWFTGPGKPEQYRSGSMYYSEHLVNQLPQAAPTLHFDRAEHRSAAQALRIDYAAQKETSFWSRQKLPGKPTLLSLWVKGNGSNDVLSIVFEDNINLTLPAWERNPNFSQQTICTLNFTDWREFQVPVVGEGLQATGLKGSTAAVDAPVGVLGFSIRPAPAPPEGKQAGDPLSIWLDDLRVETQTSPSGLIGLEVEALPHQGRLTAESRVGVTVANGLPIELKAGRVVLTARDASQQVVHKQEQSVAVPAEGFARIEFALTDLAARKPAGPIVLEAAFLDPQQPQARAATTCVLKSATHGGLVHDFEEANQFSSYQPGKVGPPQARLVAEGADGSSQALALDATAEGSSVLLHPALPGVVDQIELMVCGGPEPATLQPWLIDSGFTGVWQRPYNLFWLEPIRVDWQGWRKVTLDTPAIPSHFGDKNFYFLFRPWYPLNLAFQAQAVEGGKPTQVKIDNVRVSTHLPPADELQWSVDYAQPSRLHAPDEPLRVLVSNLTPQPKELALSFKLTHYQGFVAHEGQPKVAVAAGARQRVELLPKLAPGIYDLEVRGLGDKVLRTPILVMKAEEYFGAAPLTTLSDLYELRRTLGLTTESIYLDWDNSEGAPYLLHYNWFYEELAKRRTAAGLPLAVRGVAEAHAKAQAALAAAQGAADAANTALGAAATAAKLASDKFVAVETSFNAARSAAEAFAPLFAAAETQDAAAQAAITEATAAVEAAKRAAQEAETALRNAGAVVPEAEKTEAHAMREAEGAETRAKQAEEKAAVDGAAEEVKEAAKKAREEATAKAAARDEARKKSTEAKGARDAALAARDAAKEKIKQEEQKLREANDRARPIRAEFDKQKREQQNAQNKATALEKPLIDARQLRDEKKAARKGLEAPAQQASAALTAVKAEFAQHNEKFEAAMNEHAFRMLPIVGFSADWAGPEAAGLVEAGTYTRYTPNLLQVPRDLNSWSLFVREMLREYKDRFDAWVFWENPDLDEAPQSIPPQRYAEMLGLFQRWVRLYDPEAKVIAGGFNFGSALGYLERVPDVVKLPFDEIAVQMNLAELSPEHADVEGFLDDLNALLQLRETGRRVRITELDWGVASYLTPRAQAAYHARAAMILDSRGALPHQFSLVNTGLEFDGYGVFWRAPYGNTAELQTHLPYHIAKPAYFALIETQRFLETWDFVQSVQLPGKRPDDNRAFLYRNAAGNLTAVVWRAVAGDLRFTVPATWNSAQARDVFRFPVQLDGGLRCSELPIFIEFPAGYHLEQLVQELRTLPTADGQFGVVLDLQLAENDSRQRAKYEVQGATREVARSGALAGGVKVRGTFVENIEQESFTFTLAQPGDVLLRRRWWFDGAGGRLDVQLNAQPPEAWSLTAGQGNDPGVRESTFLLRNCAAGENRVTIKYEKPGACAGYRLEPITGEALPLGRWGVLNTRQNKGSLEIDRSAVGTPLRIGKQTFADGLGAHAVSFVEYPLAKQFEALEVTVGIDGSTEGRGSAIFRIYVDGKIAAQSGTITGFSKPQALKVSLAGAERLILSVVDAGDGNNHDLANWVDGKLFLKSEGKASP